MPEGQDFTVNLNPHSLEVIPDARVEPGLAAAAPGAGSSSCAKGYFCADPDTSPERPVFNRTVTLKDSWAKIEKKQTDS